MTATLGLTKARSLGPLADAVERAGGSARRAFRRAELPMRLLDEPEQLILLRDQMRLLDSAAREVGDDVLPARLSIAAGALGLGRLGELCCGQPTLGAAIASSNASVGATLQSSSEHGLEIHNGRARWTYALTDPGREGRQKNEMLCLGYRLDLMRRFLGARWNPCYVTLAGGRFDGRKILADVLACDVALGPMMTLVFPAALLEAPNPIGRGPATTTPDLAIADGGDIVRLVEAMIALDLLDAIPSLDRVADRLGLTRRDLQRRLADRGASFQSLRQAAQARRASDWLADPKRSITTIAQDLGYADPAHFTRAFRSWTGLGPRAWRKRAI